MSKAVEMAVESEPLVAVKVQPVAGLLLFKP